MTPGRVVPWRVFGAGGGGRFVSVVVAVCAVSMGWAGSATAATGYLSSGTAFGTVDTETFQTGSVGNLSTTMVTLARSTGGELYGVNEASSTDQRLHEISRTTGASTTVADLVDPGDTEEMFSGLTAVPGGSLYATAITSGLSSFSNQLFRVNRETGAAAPIGSAQAGVAILSLAGACDGTLYGVDESFRLVTVSRSTGVRSIVAPLAPFITPPDGVALAFEHETRTLFALAYDSDDPERIYEVDADTGALTATSFTNGAGPASNPTTLAIDSPADCRYARRLKLGFSQRKEAFAGRLRSSWRPCVARWRVVILRQRAGADQEVGSGRTNGRGAYEVPAAPRRGKYYSQVAKSASSNGICLAARSSRLNLD